MDLEPISSSTYLLRYGGEEMGSLVSYATWLVLPESVVFDIHQS